MLTPLGAQQRLLSSIRLVCVLRQKLDSVLALPISRYFPLALLPHLFELAGSISSVAVLNNSLDVLTVRFGWHRPFLRRDMDVTMASWWDRAPDAIPRTRRLSLLPMAYALFPYFPK